MDRFHGGGIGKEVEFIHLPLPCSAQNRSHENSFGPRTLVLIPSPDLVPALGTESDAGSMASVSGASTAKLGHAAPSRHSSSLSNAASAPCAACVLVGDSRCNPNRGTDKLCCSFCTCSCLVLSRSSKT